MLRALCQGLSGLAAPYISCQLLGPLTCSGAMALPIKLSACTVPFTVLFFMLFKLDAIIEDNIVSIASLPQLALSDKAVYLYLKFTKCYLIQTNCSASFTFPVLT